MLKTSDSGGVFPACAGLSVIFLLESLTFVMYIIAPKPGGDCGFDKPLTAIRRATKRLGCFWLNDYGKVVEFCGYTNLVYGIFPMCVRKVMHSGGSGGPRTRTDLRSTRPQIWSVCQFRHTPKKIRDQRSRWLNHSPLAP